MNRSEPMVFIVDDDDAVRDSLGLLMKSVGMEAHGYESAEAFLETLDPDHYGCLVLDVRMPGMSGLELQRELAERNVALPIVFITAHGDIPMAVEAIRLGASDFVQKPFDDTELLAKINAALDTSVTHHREELERNEIRRRTELLTARETQVMSQVVKGKANKVIAADLGVSQRTVEIHRARVMEKMRASSLAELVRMVLVAESDI